MENVKLGSVCEVVTRYGNTYVGKLKEVTEDKMILEDALILSIVPFQAQDGTIQQRPQLEPKNLYSSSKYFTFNLVDLVYSDEIEGTAFIAMYTESVTGYSNLKAESGSGIQVVQSMPSDLK